ncbi:MAG: divalent heavy-metal cations transporter [uncultured bacterium]|uniref:Zinc transporter, ZIP family n=4 Tax=Candidatus Daviesiibacteriota TaxID=1752718 RepID=A0A0G0EQM2_9BACT|nr:MAG: divalent heavy-metal cations transporter [uncultured bacterium]KKQ09218.1 MAG: Zinc transporter, ZIP family [Candidatus Daviesbacteria bacterium GW2011_GWB1_36_5]KKQ14729.1 MAG: Zinc transporter, ZIP family [Candidatus Daviesbacteria bacterium GW2011_GWA1_36_8]OGE17059.1 MAG: hypothetical protein A2858_01505 [Candidatus Daviesbacteria bacterium RIFCSPHIGHO2_01_FULL_36_37]OGE32692.1 MAG: hypothetical protein A3C99_03210 [Candidatus Daviesbacteria bacterium RIFCSPHIGHO2_02_FULL_37_9]OGE3
MSTLEYIIVFTLIGSVGSLWGGFLLLSREKLAQKISHLLASFAAGTLLGAAFLDLLPEASEMAGEGINVFLWTLVGMLSFFILERFIHFFHHHEQMHKDLQTKSTLPLIIFSDTIHNFIDGVVIGATFLVSIPLGIVTTLAVAAHEVPQEIGDFGLLLHRGLSKGKVILVNVLSALISLVGALLAYFAGEAILEVISIPLALTAGFFIYIAASDLIPEIHFEEKKGLAFLESVILLIGVLFVYISVSFLEHGG